MKKMMLTMGLFLGLATLMNSVSGQVQVSLNIGSQPAWGPAGYDRASYYYLPEANVYYDIDRSQFIYPDRNNWTYGRTLPRQYGYVDIYRTYKVVVNRPYPYRNNRYDVQQYGRYGSARQQVCIRDQRYYGRDNRDDRYWKNDRRWNGNNHAYRRWHRDNDDGQGYYGRYRRGDD